MKRATYILYYNYIISSSTNKYFSIHVRSYSDLNPVYYEMSHHHHHHHTF